MAGIYIHIPFCKQQCTYCDFHFSTTFEEYRQEMVNTICEELIQRRGYLVNKQIETIYFGGGTPSLLTKDELGKILNTVHLNFTVVDEPEVTLEANPDDISFYTLGFWKEYGVNRLSIGLQSFKSEDLKWMNRAHSVDESLSCVQLAKEAGFDQLTVDLMYGLPNLSIEDWEKHIDHVIDMDVGHVSAYCLTIEEKTVLDNWVQKGKVVAPNEDQQSDQFITLLRKLEGANFEQYEISNFAKEGKQSKHNSNYWKGTWYLGVGPSAHSFNGVSRQWNIANNRQYMKRIQTGSSFFEIEELSIENRINELILTGLRTSYGLNLEKLVKIGRLPKEFYLNKAYFISEGWMKDEDGYLRLTKEGKLRADFIASELFV
ncbi:MAG: radical SAM family heme chaperone HemW [Crocinitomicaceae bacterium]|nr:radical SAM family heme chaperone HemW [Crocinitomicaceae bacterium]